MAGAVAAATITQQQDRLGLRRSEPPLERFADLKARLGSGIPRLDELLGGGFIKGSTTTLMGASGIGKTLLGLQFLSAGAQRGEKSVYLGFYESPQRLIGKAESVSIPLQAACDGVEVRAGFLHGDA